MVRAALAALVATVLPVGLVVVPAVASAPTGAATEQAAAPANAVVGRRLLGRSVRGRPILAYRLGERGTRPVVLIATMHGDERDTRHILRALRTGPPIRGANLWVVPTYNPDGLARNTRKNARGVDLNRNFPFRWRDLDGPYESGPRPASEPETRAMMRFLRDVDPRRILSFHQPLYGVDQDTKNRRFARKVARTLKLPRKTFDCGGVCHGTMTGWFNDGFDGAALTVEYGPHPRRRTMTRTAPRRVLTLFDARRVRRR